MVRKFGVIVNIFSRRRVLSKKGKTTHLQYPLPYEDIFDTDDFLDMLRIYLTTSMNNSEGAINIQKKICYNQPYKKRNIIRYYQTSKYLSKLHKRRCFNDAWLILILKWLLLCRSIRGYQLLNKKATLNIWQLQMMVIL